MHPSLQARLLSINRDFYTRFAREFARTRTVEHADLSAIMPYLRDGVKLLDIGCGSGRVAERLDRERFAIAYLGVDVTPEFVAAARARAARLARVRAEFALSDISTPSWAESLRSKGAFDVALAAAVLHHLPGFELRCAVLAGIRSLLRPGGILALSSWQFQVDPRLAKKIVPWQNVGIDIGDLEPGDALIDWKRGGDGLRYCHHLTPNEIDRAAQVAGFKVLSHSMAGSEAEPPSSVSRPVHLRARKARPTGRALDLWSVLQSD